MKKQLFSILAVAAALVLSLSSCSKDDPADAVQIKTERTATVSGTIVIPQNRKPDADGKYYYAVPQMTASDITATVTYAELMADTTLTGTYTVPAENITFDAATGKYTVTTTVSHTETELVITLNDINGTQNQYLGLDSNNDPIYGEVKGVWKSAPAENPKKVKLVAGQVKNEGAWILQFTPSSENGSVAP